MHDVCNWGLVRDVQRNERASESLLRPDGDARTGRGRSAGARIASNGWPNWAPFMAPFRGDRGRATLFKKAKVKA